MPKSVFYSFHYKRDVHRIQLIRNIGALEHQPILNPQEWETVRARGNAAVEKWIHEEMSYKKAVIVLIGNETASRPWVLYEIDKAWADKKPLLGVRIHGISSQGAVDPAGENPFLKVEGVRGVPVFDPTAKDWNGAIDSKATYKNFLENIESWSGSGVTRS